MPAAKTTITSTGRVCTYCKEFKPWTAYHKKPGGINNRLDKCGKCVMHIRKNKIKLRKERYGLAMTGGFKLFLIDRVQLRGE